MSTVPGLPEYAQFDLIDRLYKSLRFAGIKPGAMAQHLGVHRNTVGHYLRGKVVPDRRTLIAWAMRCGVPFEWLAEGNAPGEGPDGGGEQPVPSTRWYGTLVPGRPRVGKLLSFPADRAA